MEVAAKVKTPKDWTVMSKTQAVNRFYTPALQLLVSQFVEAQELCEEDMRQIKGRLFATFDQHYSKWMDVILNLAHLDCLMSLTECRKSMSEPCCRPEFVESEESILELEDSRHPCVIETLDSGEYIPNDLKLETSEASMVLLTGLNPR